MSRQIEEKRKDESDDSPRLPLGAELTIITELDELSESQQISPPLPIRPLIILEPSSDQLRVPPLNLSQLGSLGAFSPASQVSSPFSFASELVGGSSTARDSITGLPKDGVPDTVHPTAFHLPTSARDEKAEEPRLVLLEPPELTYENAVNHLLGINGVARHWRTGIELMSAAAAGGHVEAQFLLFLIYKEGDFGVTPDSVEAKFWLQCAVESHHPEALTYLGHLYQNGSYGFPEDRERARDCYQRAVDLGNPLAMHNLAMLCWNNHDRAYSLQLLESAAALRESNALRFLNKLNKHPLDQKEQDAIDADDFIETRDQINSEVRRIQERLHSRWVKQFVMVLTIKFIHQFLKERREDFSFIKLLFPRTYAYQIDLVESTLAFFRQPNTPQLTPAALCSLAQYITSRPELISRREELQNIYSLWRVEENQRVLQDKGILVPPVLFRSHCRSEDDRWDSGPSPEI